MSDARRCGHASPGPRRRRGRSTIMLCTLYARTGRANARAGALRRPIEPSDALRPGWGDRDAAIEVLGAAAVLVRLWGSTGNGPSPRGVRRGPTPTSTCRLLSVLPTRHGRTTTAVSLHVSGRIRFRREPVRDHGPDERRRGVALPQAITGDRRYNRELRSPGCVLKRQDGRRTDLQRTKSHALS